MNHKQWVVYTSKRAVATPGFIQSVSARNDPAFADFNLPIPSLFGDRELKKDGHYKERDPFKSSHSR